MENSVLIDRYRKWVIQRGTETFPVTENEEGNLEIESKFALGRVNFYEDDIVELRIDMIRDQSYLLLVQTCERHTFWDDITDEFVILFQASLLPGSHWVAVKDMGQKFTFRPFKNVWFFE